MKSKTLDLTKGDILKGIITFTIPILMGSFFQQLYTMVDAVVVGQFAGKDGLAAIDSVVSFLKLPISFLNGLAVGALILISQYFGAEKIEKLQKSIHTSMTFSISGGFIISIIGAIVCPFFIAMLDVPEDIVSQSLLYVRIYYSGFVFSMIYNVGAGIMRAVGNSSGPFYILIASGITNIVLDLLFVGAFKWGVAGAAAATVIAQLVSAILVVYSLASNEEIYKLHLNKLKIDKTALKEMLAIGLPLGFQNSFYPIANMIVQASVNSLGTASIAAWSIFRKYDFVLSATAESFGMTISTFVAQNYGAKKMDRAKKGVKIGLIAAIVVIASMSIGLYIFCDYLGRLFINSADYDVIPIASEITRFIAPFFVFYVVGNILSGTIRGTGETFKPMIITMIGTCAFRIVWVLIIVPFNESLLMITASYPFSWVFTAVLYTIYYMAFKKKKLNY